MPGAVFVADVSVADGTVFAPGETFTKVWSIRSTGCAPWPAGARLVFESGDEMGGPGFVEVPETALEDTVDIRVELTAPNSPGTYKAYWQLEAADGTRFGDRFYVLISVQ
jgi:hypothetical protein